MEHNCPNLDNVLVKEHLIPHNNEWLLRSDLSNLVVVPVTFCPWCGVKLPIMEKPREIAKS